MKLEAAKRLLLADGEWFDALTDDMKEQYVKEHPDSKYAKGWKRRGHTPSDSKHDHQHNKHQHQPGHGHALVPKHPGGTPRAKQAIKKLPPHAQQFVKSGGTKSGSKSRKALAKNVKKQAKKIAKATLKDNKELASGLMSLPRILQDKGSHSDWKAARKIGVTILGSAALAGALGVSGPAGFLTFMAIKHLAGPALGSLLKKAVHRKPKLAQDGEVKNVSSKAWAATGNKSISPYGYWKDDETWVSETQEEWERNYDTREDGAGHIPRHKKHAALIVAADEAEPSEEMLASIITTLADFADNGDISDDSWDSAVEEMARSDSSNRDA